MQPSGFWIFLSFLVYPIKCDGESTLLLTQILFRHGDRSPITLYPNDPNPETFWTEGLGKLTMLGRKQHYALGKFLRSMYENFTTSSPNEVNVISSDCDRCLKSAETNLAAFFAPQEEWKFDKQLDWQPISVLYIPKIDDKYLETDSYCPRAMEEQKHILNSPEGQAFIAKHKEMFDNLTANSGSPITNWTSACYLHDTLFIEKRYNLSIPSWAAPYWEELEHVADLAFYWSFSSPLMHRLRAGPLLKKMIELMEAKIKGDIPLQKFQIYSAHDTNVAVVLNALGLFDMRQPPYCASLLFELHALPATGDHAVRLLYLNSTHPESGAQVPHVLVLEGCSEFCPLRYFVNFTKGLIPEDWESECQLDQTLLERMRPKSVTVGLLLGAACVLVVCVATYSTWRLFYRGREKYSYHLMPLG